MKRYVHYADGSGVLCLHCLLIAYHLENDQTLKLAQFTKSGEEIEQRKGTRDEEEPIRKQGTYPSVIRKSITNENIYQGPAIFRNDDRGSKVHTHTQRYFICW